MVAGFSTAICCHKRFSITSDYFFRHRHDATTSCSTCAAMRRNMVNRSQRRADHASRQVESHYTRLCRHRLQVMIQH